MSLSLREAISHAREASLRLSTDTDCVECSKEHDQLARWLEELQKYRERDPLIYPATIAPQVHHPLIPEACRGCANHPSNGGSGICTCTLGNTFQITC